MRDTYPSGTTPSWNDAKLAEGFRLFAIEKVSWNSFWLASCRENGGSVGVLAQLMLTCELECQSTGVCSVRAEAKGARTRAEKRLPQYEFQQPFCAIRAIRGHIPELDEHVEMMPLLQLLGYGKRAGESWEQASEVVRQERRGPREGEAELKYSMTFSRLPENLRGRVRLRRLASAQASETQPRITWNNPILASCMLDTDIAYVHARQFPSSLYSDLTQGRTSRNRMNGRSKSLLRVVLLRGQIVQSKPGIQAGSNPWQSPTGSVGVCRIFPPQRQLFVRILHHETPPGIASRPSQGCQRSSHHHDMWHQPHVGHAGPTGRNQAKARMVKQLVYLSMRRQEGCSGCDVADWFTSSNGLVSLKQLSQTSLTTRSAVAWSGHAGFARTESTARRRTHS